MKTRHPKDTPAVMKTEWFRTMLSQRKMSQRSLAKAMDLDPAAISLMLRGKRKLQLTEAKQIAAILSVQLNDVLLAAGIQAIPRVEAGGLQEALRRLMKHSTAYAMECTTRGDIASAQAAMSDVSAAMTLLDTMMTAPQTNAR